MQGTDLNFGVHGRSIGPPDGTGFLDPLGTIFRRQCGHLQDLKSMKNSSSLTHRYPPPSRHRTCFFSHEIKVHSSQLQMFTQFHLLRQAYETNVVLNEDRVPFWVDV
ncbi:hypothetical protein SFRURICE_013209, partial [Spodoptera frugiperda]